MNPLISLSNDKKSSWLLTFFLGLSALESILVLIWLARIPTDPKNALIGAYSASRFSILGGVFIAGVTFALLAIFNWRRRGFNLWSAKFHHHSLIAVVLFSALTIGMFVGLFLLLVPPPQLIPPDSGIAIRLAPLLVFFTLLCSQGLLLIFAFSPNAVRAWYYGLAEAMRRIVSCTLAGYMLLGISVLIAATQVFYVYYNLGDEGNTLTTGWLMSRGWRLYSEVFSHHLPFSYIWVVFVVKLFGGSIFALRLSLILLRTLVFAVAMKLSHYTFALGLTALAWSILGHFYLGNGLYYHSFSGIFLVAAFAIGLAIITGQISGSIFELGAIGLLLGLAVLSDPLKLLPAGVIILAVFISGLSKAPVLGRVRHGVVQAGTIVLFMAFCGITFTYWLITTNSSVYFYKDVIAYNLNVYSKYSTPLDVRDIISPTVNLLDLFNAQWRTQLNPYYEWYSFRFLDIWIFTGFFYRLVIVLASVILLIRGKFLSFVYVYLFGAMMLIRASTFFHSSPFVLYSLGIGSLFISGSLSSEKLYSNEQESHKDRKQRINIVAAFNVLAWLVVFTMFTWLNIRGIGFLLDNREKMSYSEKFAGLEGDAAYLRKMTCHQAEARLLVYPYEPIQYFASQILPASKYHFLPPWVAEIGQAQVIADLQEAPTLVLINREGSVWGYEVQDYLADLLQYLDENYFLIEKPDRYTVYRSPKLEQLCQDAPSN